MTRADDSGFTLVEALVSLFVFSLIATGCTIMLMQSVASQKRVAEAGATLSELQSARALLNGDMIQIAPRRSRTDLAHTPSFSGAGAEGVDFVRAYAEPDSESGVAVSLAHVRYVLDAGRLLRRTWSDPDTVETAAPSERVVFAAIENVRFEFYDGANWRDRWESVNGLGLPRAIAVIGTVPRYGEIRLEAMTGAAR